MPPALSCFPLRDALYRFSRTEPPASERTCRCNVVSASSFGAGTLPDALRSASTSYCSADFKMRLHLLLQMCHFKNALPCTANRSVRCAACVIAAMERSSVFNLKPAANPPCLTSVTASASQTTFRLCCSAVTARRSYGTLRWVFAPTQWRTVHYLVSAAARTSKRTQLK